MSIVQVESLKKELVKKETEIEGWKLKFEAFGSQHGEHQQYITLLKEQITAKEKNLTMLQADVSHPIVQHMTRHMTRHMTYHMASYHSLTVQHVLYICFKK